MSARTIGVAGVVCSAVIAGTAIGFLRPFEAQITRILSGVSEYGRFFGGAFAQVFRTNDDRGTLLTRVASLENDLASCRLSHADSVALQAMDQAVLARDAIKLIPARVIGVSPDTDHSLIVINKGTSDGVAMGSGVIADNGIFIGKVVATNAWSSSVRLPVDSRSKVIATFASTTPSRGLVEGQFQVGMRMNLIPNTEQLNLDTIVVTSGLEEGIPSGLVIGRIRDIQSQPTDLFKSASVEPAIDYASLRLVSVVAEGAKK